MRDGGSREPSRAPFARSFRRTRGPTPRPELCADKEFSARPETLLAMGRRLEASSGRGSRPFHPDTPDTPHASDDAMTTVPISTTASVPTDDARRIASRSLARLSWSLARLRIERKATPPKNVSRHVTTRTATVSRPTGRPAHPIRRGRSRRRRRALRLRRVADRSEQEERAYWIEKGREESEGERRCERRVARGGRTREEPTSRRRQ